MPLRYRISLVIFLIVLVTGASIGVVVDRDFRGNIELIHERMGRSLVQAVSKAVLGDTIAGNRRKAHEILRRITADNAYIDYIAIIGFDGQLFASARRDGTTLEAAGAFHADRNNGLHEMVVAHDDQVHDISDAMVENLGAHIHLGFDESQSIELIHEQRVAIIAVVILLSLLGVLPALYIGKRLGHPLHQLTGMLQLFGRDQLQAIPRFKSSDPDLQALHSSFTTMVAERRAVMESLRASQNKLNGLNDGLEQRILDRTEELNEARLAAEIASQAKSVFLSQMSHELRTPLNAILGFSQIMEMDGQGRLSADDLAAIREIRQAGDHLLKLISEILDVSQVELGQLMVSMEDVCLCDVIAETISQLKVLAQARGISLTYPDGNCKGLVVKADYSRLKQVLLNLTGNAIKYNRDGGSVAIACSSQDGGSVRVDITDSGFGIEAKDIDRLFQPFERLGMEKKAIDGTGIGLVICKKLIEVLGGTIGVESIAGVGSTFWISLLKGNENTVCSASRTGAAVAGVSVSEAPGGSRVYRLLYVEDNRTNQRFMQKLYQHRTDRQLHCVDNAEEGIEYAMQERPDLILMDIRLPGMNGNEALQLLRSQAGTRHIPVVAVSAEAMREDVARSMALGFDAYVTKPFQVAELNRTIDELLCCVD